MEETKVILVLEDWRGEYDDVRDVFSEWLVVDVPDDHFYIDASNLERAKLAAAAPRMLRMLLLGEWVEDTDEEIATCPSCLTGEYCVIGDKDHNPGCALNALLIELGFPTPESRDAAREAIRKAFP